MGVQRGPCCGGVADRAEQPLEPLSLVLEVGPVEQLRRRAPTVPALQPLALGVGGQSSGTIEFGQQVEDGQVVRDRPPG
jgi:hypothetical protein